MNRCGLMHRLWIAANTGRWRRFRRALQHPEEAQMRILRRLLRANRASSTGRRLRFDAIDSYEHFRNRVPLSTYEDYQPFIERIIAGEAGELTSEPVRRLMPSSGSSAARKLIPYTASLQREFGRAIAPWIVDLYSRRPDLREGPSYWSVSPAANCTDTPSRVPIGYEEDSAYLGGLLQSLVDATLAVPGFVSRIRDMETFRYVTLLFLLRRPELRLISVWNPSFLTLLIDDAPRHWDRLLEDLKEGTFTPPQPLERALRAALAQPFRANPGRAQELHRCGPRDVVQFWKRLAVISCWGDAHASGGATDLAQRFPGVEIQHKGLLATEAFVTLPFDGHHPLAVTSHFFEFLDDDGRALLAHELSEGGEYQVVVTTGGGLYRYRLGDRVRVESRMGATPSLRFLGKEDHVSDRCGEKLTAAHVGQAVEGLLHDAGIEATFSMLAPDEHRRPVGYSLYLETAAQLPPDLASRLDRLLAENPHYDYCLRLGQLAPAQVFQVRGDAQRAYLDAIVRRGGRLGEIKPSPLSNLGGWSRIFAGDYQVRP
jgi:hypothetical protein